MCWFWLVLGLLLMGAELRFGTFYVIWFGVGALFVSGWVYVYPDATLGSQIFLWVVTAATMIWSRFSMPPPEEGRKPPWRQKKLAIQRRKRSE